jgi:hypothetical protein
MTQSLLRSNEDQNERLWWIRQTVLCRLYRVVGVKIRAIHPGEQRLYYKQADVLLRMSMAFYILMKHITDDILTGRYGNCFGTDAFNQLYKEPIQQYGEGIVLFAVLSLVGNTTLYSDTCHLDLQQDRKTTVSHVTIRLST